MTGARRASGRRQSTPRSPSPSWRRRRVRGGQHRALARARDHAGRAAPPSPRYRLPGRGHGGQQTHQRRELQLHQVHDGRAHRQDHRAGRRAAPRRSARPAAAAKAAWPLRARPASKGSAVDAPAKPRPPSAVEHLRRRIVGPEPGQQRRRSHQGRATRGPGCRPERAARRRIVSAPVVQAAMHCAQSMQRCSSTMGRPSRTRMACVGQADQAGAAVPAPVGRGVQRDGRRREGDLRAAGRC